MKKKIVVERGEVGKLAELMGCTRVMVSYSLSYRKNSRLAKAIRKLAIERGGVRIGGEENRPLKTESHERGIEGAVRI